MNVEYAKHRIVCRTKALNKTGYFICKAFVWEEPDQFS